MKTLVFISYETKTGLNYAAHLKEALDGISRIGISAFVADEDIPKGKQWQNIIDEALTKCRYFVVIMTMGAIFSPNEVKREIELADRLHKHIIPCRLRTLDRLYTNMLPMVGKLQHVDFIDKEDLAEQVVTEIIKREEIDVSLGVEKARRKETEARPPLTAALTEFHNVQAAIMAMMVDNNLSRIPRPSSYAAGIAQNDMSAFPDAITTPDEKGYTGAGTPRGGYVLYNHDKIGADSTVFDTVSYVDRIRTRYYYTCEPDGTIRQFNSRNMSVAVESTHMST